MSDNNSIGIFGKLPAHGDFVQRNLDSNFLMLSIQIVCGAILTILICEITNFKDYKYLKTIIIEQLSRKAIK